MSKKLIVLWGVLLSYATAARAQMIEREVWIRGVHGKVPVTVKEVSRVSQHGSSNSHSIDYLAQQFFNTLPTRLNYEDFENESVSVFSVVNKRAEQAFWYGSSSSLGDENTDALVFFLQNELANFIGQRCYSSTKENSVMSRLFINAPHSQFVQGAKGYADLIVGLTPNENPEYINLDRPSYSINCDRQVQYSGFNYQIFFVDPTPSSGPNTLGYIVAVKRVVYE